MHKGLVFWGLCAILVFVPLPIGSVEPWAIFVFEAATLVLFLVYLVGEYVAGRRAAAQPASGAVHRPRFAGPPETGFKAIGKPEDHEGEAPPAGLPRAVKVLIAVFLAFSALQLVPLPPLLVRILSPRAASIYRGMARDGLTGWDARSFWTLSLAPFASAANLLLLVCYGLFGYLVLRTVRTRRRIETFVLVVIASALFQAFYGMAETFSGSEQIFGYQKRYDIGSVTGTYINRNDFAGLMEMAFPLSLGYLLAKARFFLMEKGLPWRKKFLWFSQESLQWSLLFGLGTVFIGLGLVFSKSRSGIMIFLLTLLVAAAAFGGWRELSDRADDRKRLRGILRVTVAVVVAGALWLGIGPVIERFGEMDISKEARRTFAANTLRMAADFPLTGAGKGTFLYAYPLYRKVDEGYQLSYAHNDYLQLAAENGVIAAGCLIAAAVLLIVFLAGKWRRRRANFAKGVGLGAILSIAAMLIHEFTDFNLQIPANAVYFVALGMLAVNVVGKGKRENGDGRSGNGDGAVSSAPGATEVGTQNAGQGCANGPRRSKPLASIALAVFALALLVVAALRYRGYYYLGRYNAARSAARSVQADFGKLEPLARKAAASWPNAELEKDAARLYFEMARAENDSGGTVARDKSCDRAVARYVAALRLDPLDSFVDYEMGVTYLLYNFPLMTYADKAKLYFRKALELNPSEEFLNLNILNFYLTSWSGLTDSERAYAAGRLRAVRAVDPAFVPQLEERWKRQFGATDSLDRILASLEIK